MATLQQNLQRPFYIKHLLERLRYGKAAAAMRREAAELIEKMNEDSSNLSAQNSAQAMQIDELKRDLAAAQEWREAVLNELIVAHTYTKEHDTNPRKAIQDAIIWNCQVALDPAVSSDAQKLIAADALDAKDARIRELEGALRECADDLEAELTHRYDGMLNYPVMKRRYDSDMSTVTRAREALK